LFLVHLMPVPHDKCLLLLSLSLIVTVGTLENAGWLLISW
jgi:hypothetical protein